MPSSRASEQHRLWKHSLLLLDGQDFPTTCETYHHVHCKMSVDAGRGCRSQDCPLERSESRHKATTLTAAQPHQPPLNHNMQTTSLVNASWRRRPNDCTGPICLSDRCKQVCLGHPPSEPPITQFRSQYVVLTRPQKRPRPRNLLPSG
jgi:hypothetical protein